MSAAICWSASFLARTRATSRCSSSFIRTGQPPRGRYLTLLTVNGRIYQKLQPWERSAGKIWTRIDLPNTSGGSSAASGGSAPLSGPPINNASRALDLLLGAGKVIEVDQLGVAGQGEKEIIIDWSLGSLPTPALLSTTNRQPNREAQ